MLKGSSFTYKDDLFTNSQQQALQEYNALLSSLNISTSNSFQENRLAALELFCTQHNGNGAVGELDGAFRMLYGHWVNGEDPKVSLKKILSQLSRKEMDSLCEIVHYRSSFVKLQGIAPTKRSCRINTVCLAHPDRKAVARGLCSTCYVKAFRLKILHLPMGQWLITLLKKRKPRDKSQCVNHAEIPAYADGLCVECLRKAKRLAPLLGVEICHVV